MKDGYGGQQGESGKTPAKVGSKSGVYANSTNSMGPATTPNKQGWPGYECNNKRGAGFSSNVGADRKSGGGDY